MLKQGLSQKLLQKLSPQQIQYIKLLQLNTLDLEKRIEEEMMENPALETGKEESDEEQESSFDAEKTEEIQDSAEEEDTFSERDDDLDISEYLNYDQDDYDGFHLADDGNGQEEERKEMPITFSKTINELLMEQYAAISNDERETLLGEQIIGSIEEDGYLRRPLSAIVNDLAFSVNINTTEQELEKILKKVQSLDPAGIGARTLQECLLLQLYRKDQHQQEVQLAIEIIRNYMDDFIKKHYEKLMRSLKCSEAALKEALNIIIHLNPKPGESQTESKTQYVIPDFILVTDENERLKIVLNSRNAPEMKLSRSYMETLKGYEKTANPSKQLKETVTFIKQKLDSAKWFIDSIKQRQQTLLLTMNAILELQYEFFLTGDETRLRPMILKDIADRVGLDISTISRVANSKYIETDFGIYSLKYFFSEGITTEEGEEVSNREVKKILSDCIANEDKSHPLPDEKLMEILKEKGYNIARRTVAKYREQLNIPVARLRKQL